MEPTKKPKVKYFLTDKLEAENVVNEFFIKERIHSCKKYCNG
jgi:hypothetical protein